MKVRPHLQRIIGLTGTPSSDGLMDLWAELKVLDMGQRLGRFIGQYRNEYFLPDKRNGGINCDGIPHAYNPKADEDRLIKSIDEIDVLRERYRQAVEYMKWFKTAWQELPEDEQYALETFYLVEGCQGAVYDICDHFHIERSSAYNKKNRALEHLTALLFGKV